MEDQQLSETIRRIARENFPNREHLKDPLATENGGADFFEVAVWNLEKALRLAYRAGWANAEDAATAHIPAEECPPSRFKNERKDLIKDQGQADAIAEHFARVSEVATAWAQGKFTPTARYDLHMRGWEEAPDQTPTYLNRDIDAAYNPETHSLEFCDDTGHPWAINLHDATITAG